jgi:phage-related protein
LQATKQARIDFLISDPYRYVVSEADQTITTFPTTVNNPGTYLTQPLLHITGSGTVVLALNGVTMTYIFPAEETYFHLDCASFDTYYDTVANLRNRSMTITGGTATLPFPTLATGNNTLSVTSGTVTEVIVTKRTRYL